jgi:hypothetical protein
MSQVISGLKRVTAKPNWAGRGASFMAKVKATKAVWLPPKPTKTGKQAASTAKKTARKTTGKSAAAVKKSTGRARKVASPVRRKTA